MDLPVINVIRRVASPAVTPQALTRHNKALWLSSRDKRRLYGINVEGWNVFEETETPGIPWAAVGTSNGIIVTSGEGPDDDRYFRLYVPGIGFDQEMRIAVPEFTGSYLSYDGKDIYLSQWHKHRILKLGIGGQVMSSFAIGAEISGHVFAGEHLFVLCGTEAEDEDWHVARVDLQPATPLVEPLARILFACRSLAFEGASFWTNHRKAGDTIEFSVPSR